MESTTKIQDFDYGFKCFLFPSYSRHPNRGLGFYEKEEVTHEEVEGGELRSAGPEGRTRGGGGADRCHVELRHDGGEEFRGQVIQALSSGLAGRHFGFGFGFLGTAQDLARPNFVRSRAELVCSLIFPRGRFLLAVSHSLKNNFYI